MLKRKFFVLFSFIMMIAFCNVVFCTESIFEPIDILLDNNDRLIINMPEDWEREIVELLDPTSSDDNDVLSRFYVSHLTENGFKPLIYVRINRRSVGVLEGISLLQDFIDELCGTRECLGVNLSERCSVLPEKELQYRFKDTVYVGRIGEELVVNVDQNSCGVFITSSFLLDDGIAVEIGFMSSADSFEEYYHDYFIPCLRSIQVISSA